MTPSKRNSLSLFFSQCRENFSQTGALVPSSQGLARAITAEIVSCGQPRRILEVGPGTGVFTAEIAAKMGPFDHLDIHEINQAFADHLEERLLRDPAFQHIEGRVTLHRGDVLNLAPEATYDRIISSIPLNNFDPDTVRRFLEVFMLHLTPGGILSYFEYVLVRALKQAVSRGPERDRLRGIGEVTGDYVRRFQVRSDPVLFNLPPAVARHLLKPLHNESPVRKSSPALRPAAAVQ